jgi:ribonuclease Z
VKVDTCYVKHCPHAFGVSLEMKNVMKSDRHPRDTVKITYSGDTLPCDELVNIGRESDILIHEATMEDDLAKEARIKMHSTVGQAIDIGRRMNSKFTILTHFSQRYAKIPMMEKNVENVAIGFDNMEVTLNDLPMMHLMYEPLKVMFSDHFELMEQKTQKRKYQQERKIEINLPNGNSQNKVKKFNSSDED